MTAPDLPATDLAQGWCILSLLHSRIERHIEGALHTHHGLSAREYALLDVLSRQHDGDNGHLQMKQVADAVALSQSATTRLVTRLEDRGLLSRYLCPTDRRGIYTNVTDAGMDLLRRTRPTYEATLREALDCLDRSTALRAALGDDVVEHYLHCGRWEQFEYDRRITDHELIRGFERA